MEKKNGKGPAKKDFNDYSKHHQNRIKHQLKEELQTTRSFLHDQVIWAKFMDIYADLKLNFNCKEISNHGWISLSEHVPIKRCDSLCMH